MAAEPPIVVMMCGLPASGKTTTAARLHARLGGTLIRSCDVYRDLGISVPDWVRRTHGFTRNVAAYDAVRDRAYVEMARRLDHALVASVSFVIVDAVHGEPEKRDAVYKVCHARGATPLLLFCHCHDPAEVARRLRARVGREREPRHEASDFSVLLDISRRWRDPAEDQLPDGRVPTVITYETCVGVVRLRAGSGARGLDCVLASLEQRSQWDGMRAERELRSARDEGWGSPRTFSFRPLLAEGSFWWVPGGRGHSFGHRRPFPPHVRVDCHRASVQTDSLEAR